MFFSRFLSILVLLFLASCQPAVVQPTPPAQEIWQVQITPSLRWLGQSMNQCARELPQVGLLVFETAAQEMDSSGADFSLRWGEPVPGRNTSLILGQIAWSFIVHKSNPVTEIGKADLERIFNGTATSWSDLKECKSCSSVKNPLIVFLYAVADDARTGIDFLFPGLPARLSTAILAPDAQSILEAVRQESGAIGFIPALLGDASVKKLNVTGLSPQNFQVPLMASVKSVDEVKKAWLLCLQTRLKNP